jgi:alkylation response protein AidB-like acyl-CoA dehydrogenase
VTVLNSCREQADKHLCGGITAVASASFEERERGTKEILADLKGRGLAGLAISTEHRGKGLSARSLAEVLIALGATVPSVAIATNMHTFSVASLRALEDTEPNVWVILEAIASQGLLLASGFAEGKTGQSIVKPVMTGIRMEGGYIVNGTKRPCSLARSMDIFSASFALSDDDDHYGVGLIPADNPGLRVDDFWVTPILAGAESEAVEVTDVFVPDEAIVRVPNSDKSDVNMQDIGFVWFELLMSAAYLGMVDRLVELAFETPRSRGIVQSAAAIPAVYEALFSFADKVNSSIDQRTLSLALSVRALCQRVVTDTVPNCLDTIGGVGFIRNPEVSYLAGATQCLRFHPPAMSRMTDDDATAIYKRTLATIR